MAAATFLHGDDGAARFAQWETSIHLNIVLPAKCYSLRFLTTKLMGIRQDVRFEPVHISAIWCGCVYLVGSLKPLTLRSAWALESRSFWEWEVAKIVLKNKGP
eukprot:1280203-Amphidinium_carterae.1